MIDLKRSKTTEVSNVEKGLFGHLKFFTLCLNTFLVDLDSGAIAAKIHHGSIHCISFTSQGITSPDQSELIIVRIHVTSAAEAIITDSGVSWGFRKVRFGSLPPESSSLEKCEIRSKRSH